MATEPKTPAPVETVLGTDRTTTFDGDGPALLKEGADGTAEVDLSELGLDDEEGSDTVEGGGAEGDDTAAGAEGDDTTEGAEGDGNEAGEDLGDYDPDNEEVRAKFDAKYTNPETGELNKDAIGSEFWSNLAKAQEQGGEVKDHGYLNKATYDYLKDTYKVTEDFIQEIEQGLVAKAAVERQTFFASVGGEARFQAAAAWARSGGYTKEQRARFNELMAKPGPDRDDAVEALMNRAYKAGALRGVPGEPARKADNRPGRRPSSPQKDATRGAAVAGGGGTSSSDTFKTSGEYEAAFKEVNAMPYRSPTEKKAKDDAFKKLREKGRRSRLA